MKAALPQLCALLRSGELTLPDYLAQLQARFELTDPLLQAFVEEEHRFERLQREAGDLSRRFPDTAQRPPLFGVALGVKDIFHVAGFVTRAGTRIPSAPLQGAEASCVRRLKELGALILGKTVTAEFAFIAPGPTRNPCNPAHTPGGSSSGSAAAVAAHLCPLALATQTIGSINRPAAYCGTAGFKPSLDSIPKDGVIPLAPSTDHVGWIAADVASARYLASLLLAGEPAPVRKPVLAVPQGTYLERTELAALASFDETCEQLRGLGYTVLSLPALADFEAAFRHHHTLVAAEAARVHRLWYAQFGDLYRPETQALIERGMHVSEAELARARTAQLAQRQNLSGWMAKHGVDLWLSPSATGPAPKGLQSTGDSVMQLPWTQAGLPLLSLPTKLIDGLPVGIQLAGRYREDLALLDWAWAMERSLPSFEPETYSD